MAAVAAIFFSLESGQIGLDKIQALMLPVRKQPEHLSPGGLRARIPVTQHPTRTGLALA